MFPKLFHNLQLISSKMDYFRSSFVVFRSVRRFGKTRPDCVKRTLKSFNIGMAKKSKVRPLALVKRNQASRERRQKSRLYSCVTTVRNSRIYKKGKHVMTVLGNTRVGSLVMAILNVEEAGVYSESKVDAFQVFYAQSSNFSYLSILWYGLIIPMPSLFGLLVSMFQYKIHPRWLMKMECFFS